MLYSECLHCAAYDCDYCCCTIFSMDRWYACPVESQFPENQQAILEMAEFYSRPPKQD